jgi:hypothetical protein
MMDDLIERRAVIGIIEKNYILGQGLLNDTLDHIAERIMQLPPAQPNVIHCKDCRYYKDITSIHGECESADMWRSLFGEVTEVEAIEVHKDHYCGYAERRTDE